MEKPPLTIKLEAVNATVVDKYLAQFKLSLAGTISQKVARLAAHQAKTPVNQRGDCDTCGSICDLRLPVCPFCGTGDTEAGEVAAKSEGVPADLGDAPPSEEEDDDEIDLEDDEDDEDDEDSEEEEEEEPVAPSIETVGVIVPPAPKAKRSKVEHVDDERSTLVADLSGLSEADLDADIARIQDLRKGAVVSYWELATAVHDLYRARKFTLRQGEDGSPKYRHWNQFVAAELGMSVQHSHALIEVAANFTREDIETAGVAKLALIAKVPPADRQMLLDRAKSGDLSVREASSEVRRLNEGRAPRTDTAASAAGGPGFRGGAAALEAASATKKAASDAKVTAAVVLGKKTIQLVRKDSPDKVATQLSHDPVAEEQLLNGVVTRYRVIKNAKGLALVVERIREDAKGKGKKR